MAHILERTDARLVDLVRNELVGQQSLGGTQIFVAVDHGAATLFGWVQRRSQAQRAESAALRVDGIVAVAEELFIGPPAGMTDTDIAKQAAHALLRTARVEGVRATVRNRVMTLSGDVDWPYESDAACRAVKDIGRTEVIINEMNVRSPSMMAELNATLRTALSDAAGRQRNSVTADADSQGVITVAGTVGTEEDRSTVQQTCWAVAGVTEVVDHITVRSRAD